LTHAVIRANECLYFIIYTYLALPLVPGSQWVIWEEISAAFCDVAIKECDPKPSTPQRTSLDAANKTLKIQIWKSYHEKDPLHQCYGLLGWNWRAVELRQSNGSESTVCWQCGVLCVCWLCESAVEEGKKLEKSRCLVDKLVWPISRP
jgi:hypothetical protein